MDESRVDDGAQAGESPELELFWIDARIRAGLNISRPYLGPNQQDLLLPRTCSLGSTPEETDRLLALVLDGRITGTSSAATDYADDELPRPGQLTILLDGAGHPRALIRTTEVRVAPFDAVDEEHSRAEGEDGVPQWRTTNAFLAGDDETADVALERFEVLVPVESRPGSPRLFGLR